MTAVLAVQEPRSLPRATHHPRSQPRHVRIGHAESRLRRCRLAGIVPRLILALAEPVTKNARGGKGRDEVSVTWRAAGHIDKDLSKLENCRLNIANLMTPKNTIRLSPCARAPWRPVLSFVPSCAAMAVGRTGDSTGGQPQRRLAAALQDHRQVSPRLQYCHNRSESTKASVPG